VEAKVSTWKSVSKIIANHVFEPDLEALRIIASVAATTYLCPKLPPTWLYIIAPSGFAKTEYLSFLDHIPNYHSISTLTPKSFLSGYIQPKSKTELPPPSLLHRIGPLGILGVKDFTSIFSSHPNDKRAILAALREIHDGHFDSHTGTGSQSWEGRLTVIGCSVPTIDDERQAFRMMGDRFIEVWLKIPEPSALADALLSGTYDIDSTPLQDAFSNYITQLAVPKPLDKKWFQELNDLACLIALSRAAVAYDHQGYHITEIAPPESPARVVQALKSIAICSAALEKTEVTESEISLARRVAIDSIPQNRLQVLLSIPLSGISRTNLNSKFYGSRRQFHRSMEECEAIQLIEEKNQLYFINPKYSSLFQTCLASTPKYSGYGAWGK
jgi:hypothetical protein